jgi:addiction module HigA family antidote
MLSDALAGFPRPLDSYADAAGASLVDTLAARIHAEPFNAIATAIFLLAVLHTLSAARFTTLAHRVKAAHDEQARARGLPATGHIGAELLHFLGEIEVVFGLWAVVLALAGIFLWRWIDQPKRLLRTKWVAVPDRCDDDMEWGVHNVYAVSSRTNVSAATWRVRPDNIYYRHFRQLTTKSLPRRREFKIYSPLRHAYDRELVAAFAKAIGVSRQTVNDLIRERRALSPKMALLLSRLFGNSAQFWLNAQSAFDLWRAAKSIKRKINRISPLNAA